MVSALSAQVSEIDRLLSELGIQPTATERGQMDIVGFASTAKQMDGVLAQCRVLSPSAAAAIDSLYNFDESSEFIAAVCPHDDYYYAGRLYSLIFPRIKAKRVVIFGVFHKARIFDCQDKLVFDAYQTWHAPYGPVKVSTLREEILHKLPAEDYIVNNDMQMVEHSVEAMMPFLQAYNREVEIVSILVPYMNWDTVSKLADELSQVLFDICRGRGWVLGKDLCFIFSADAVHYGDSGWGTTYFAPYGCDVQGYETMVRAEVDLIKNCLAGEITQDKVRDFMFTCVDADNPHQYRRTWCGRFSVPMGLLTVSRLLGKLEQRHLNGYFLDYGTSVSEASLEEEGLEGLGPTAPNNLHHWVGYAAVGYR